MRREVLALIPARGGSKGVPRKNVIPIAGKPLIAYSIGHALGCAAVTRTVVSTDDEEIAEVSREFGAEVPFVRPSHLATDDANDYEVIRHALEHLSGEGYLPELVVHLRPTEPLRSTDTLAAAIRTMLAHPEADSLRSVSVADESPYKMWRIEGDYLRPVVELPELCEAHSMPRQKLPVAYRQNGYVDIVRPRTILKRGSICGDVVVPFVIDGPVPGLDYPDQIEDLERALRANTPSSIPPVESSWMRYPT